MEAVIQPGVYSDRLVLSEETREMDDIYGICEGRNQALTLTPNNTFQFNYHYFYESEDGCYNITSQTCQDINIKGSVTAETASVWICNLSEGKYRNDTLQHKDSGDQLTGRFKITAKPDRVIQISEVRVTKKDGLPCKFAMNQLEGMKMQRQKQ